MARSSLISTLALNVDEVIQNFKTGGGVASSKYCRYCEGMFVANKSFFDQHLLSSFLPLASEVHRRMSNGEKCKVLDIGSGSGKFYFHFERCNSWTSLFKGYAVLLMAKNFPSSEFFGIDLFKEAIEKSNKEALQQSSTNAHFIQFDWLKTDIENWKEHFDLITAFDVIHELPQTQSALNRIYQCLSAKGYFLMYELNASSNLEDNINKPMSALLYGLSTLYCTTLAMAEVKFSHLEGI